MPGHSIPVSNFLSNLNDQLVAAARIVGRSKHRQSIFRIVYSGPRQTKSIKEIAKLAGISEMHVLKEGGQMAGLLLEKVPGGYRKKKEFAPRYRTILNLAKNEKKRDRIPTKVAPKGLNSARVIVSFPPSAQEPIFVTLDQIDSFSKVDASMAMGVKNLAESRIKRGFARILREPGRFKDWGGEKSDLYSTRTRLGGKRLATAIAFKGKGTSGKLVPAKMGKNGDQINRLFDEPAQLFLVVYGGQVDSSIISQMKAFAIGHAMAGRKIYYGIIDGTDLSRLVAAYPKAFK